ncbi:TPA: hypothetical protein ACPP8F_000907 [Haemophilus influenzae]|uniref:hypothetical protein n=1 Tax=Haemophilus influenzae TaxID=727 RepID=UPI001F46400C|nr:hypothetical protein [Haemophilus influenzae]
MKYIDKKIEESRTGASASYHVVSGLQTEYTSGNTFVTISSYVSKDKKEEGKESLSVNTFTVPGVPDWDAIPYEWALSELVKTQPEDFAPENYHGYINPYIFAGGKIKDLEVK